MRLYHYRNTVPPGLHMKTAHDLKKDVEGLGRQFVSLWPVTDFPQNCVLSNSHKRF